MGQEARDTSVLMRFIILDVQAGNWNEAVQVYNKAAPEVTLGSHFPKITASFDVRFPRSQRLQAAAHVALGIARSKREEYEQSVQEYAEALRLHPGSPLAHYYLGYSLRKMGRGKEAKEEFRKAANLGRGEVKAAAERELR